MARAVDLASGRPGQIGQPVRAPATEASCIKCVGAAVLAVVAGRAPATAFATCSLVRSSRTSAPANAPPTTMFHTMAPCTSGLRIMITSSPARLHAGGCALCVAYKNGLLWSSKIFSQLKHFAAH